MISQSLKQSTKDAHLLLEKKVIARLKNIKAQKDYGELLQYFYVYFSALEQLISPFITADVLPDIAKRRKVDLLRQDILTTGANPEVVIPYTLPNVSSVEQALGVMYVMEGSTLGGAVIVNMLRDKMGFAQGLSFFSGYGSDTKDMWARFVNTINEYNRTELQAEQMIQAANETFLHFSNLFK